MRWFVAIGLLTFIAGSSPVRAAEPHFCREYAESAVDQSRRALDDPRCERGARGPRWSTNYRYHYDWCLGARHESAREEREVRHEHLERCHWRR